MIALTKKIYEQALDLPTEERIYLIDKLLHSANIPIQKEVDRAWTIEAEKRYNEIQNGNAKLIPVEEIFKKVSEKFAK